MIEPNDYCLYERLDNGIHRVELTHHSIMAADAYLELLDQLICTATENDDDKIRLMVVISSPKMPSLQYLAKRIQNIIVKYPNRPSFRNVYLFGESFMVNLLHMFVKSVAQRGTDRVSFFQYGKTEDAIQWLLEDD